MKCLVATRDEMIRDFLWEWLGSQEEIVLAKARHALDSPDGNPGWVVATTANEVAQGQVSCEATWVSRVLAVSVGSSPIAPHPKVVTLQLPASAESLNEALALLFAAPPSAAEPPKNDTSSSCVLVVEDSDSQRAMVVAALKSEGFRVLEAENGRLGLETLRRVPVDVVVTDVEMPEMTGLELTRAIRAESRLSALPVLMTTTLSGFQQVREGFDAGASDYVVKPVKGEREAYLDEMIRRIYAFLEQLKVVEGKSAVVVDDSPAIRQMVAGILRDNGFTVSTAENGEVAKAIIAMEASTLDLVVTDLEMPVLDGLQLTHWAKRNESTRDIPVIILSASTQRQHRVLGRGFGADAFLTKTLIEEKLLITIELVMARTRMGRERRELARILGRDVFKAVHGAGLQAKDQEVAVLFSDIVGFSTLCGRKTAAQVVDMLNDYFDVMVDCVSKEQGYVNKFIGDAIMAIFSAQPGLDAPPIRAIRAGLAMQRADRQRNQVRTEPIMTRIGVNTGTVILGLIGGGERKDYTVIGDEVNRAQRFEGKCTPGGVLVSDNTWNAARHVIEPMPDVQVERVDGMVLKGISQLVTAWSLTPKE